MADAEKLLHRVGTTQIFQKSNMKTTQNGVSPEEIGPLILNSHKGLIILEYKDIVRFQAEGNYSYVFFTDGTRQVVTKTLGYFEELLSHNWFFRCHRSHLVNLDQVKGISKNKQWNFELHQGGDIPIAFRKKSSAIKEVSRIKF